MTDSFLQERFLIEDHIHAVKELLMNRSSADREMIVSIVCDDLRTTLDQTSENDPFVRSVEKVRELVAAPQSLDANRVPQLQVIDGGAA